MNSQPRNPKTKPKGFGAKKEKQIRQYSEKELKVIKRKRKQQNDIINNRLKKTCSFKNKLKERWEVAEPNLVWCMDFTRLPIVKEG